MPRPARALAGLLVVFVCPVGVLAQTPPAQPPSSSTPQAAPMAAPVECGDPPPAEPCAYYVCVNGVYQRRSRTAGTSCNDGNLCTHTDKCDGGGNCVGTTISCPSTSCKTCNGTSTCGNATAGTACSTVPGFDSACGCTSGGACTVKSFTSGAAATGICWDARGNLRAKYVAPVGASCKAACPSP